MGKNAGFFRTLILPYVTAIERIIPYYDAGPVIFILLADSVTCGAFLRDDLSFLPVKIRCYLKACFQPVKQAPKIFYSAFKERNERNDYEYKQRIIHWDSVKRRYLYICIFLPVMSLSLNFCMWIFLASTSGLCRINGTPDKQ